jgi:hypothetical protein
MKQFPVSSAPFGFHIIPLMSVQEHLVFIIGQL